MHRLAERVTPYACSIDPRASVTFQRMEAFHGRITGFGRRQICCCASGRGKTWCALVPV